MSFEKYAKFMSIAAFVVMVLLPPISFYYVCDKGSESVRVINEWWSVKENYARSINGNKIILLSGSNTLFGVDCSAIAFELGVPVVNMGTHAGLFPYYLDRVKRSLKRGDIIICPFEYTVYYKDTLIDNVRFLRAYDSEYIMNCAFTRRLEYIYGCNLHDLMEDVIGCIIRPSKKTTGYDAKYLNINGDMENNPYEKRRTIIKGEPFGKYDGKIPNSEAERAIKDFAEYCDCNGIKFFITYPVYFYGEREFRGKDLCYVNEIKQNLELSGIRYLGDYDQSLYTADMFYDTVYHLNNVGKRKHTRYLTELLKNCIGEEIELMKIRR